MSQTFTQIYIHIVFAVRNRKSLITPDWEDALHKYLTVSIQSCGQKMIAINGMPDHIHMLIGMKPNCHLSDLIREIKKSSCNWINGNRFSEGHFHWQDGFGAFSHNQSSLDNVVNYIHNQKDHHDKQNLKFRKEFETLLREFKVNYKEEYLFEQVL
jgi:putative transposase